MRREGAHTYEKLIYDEGGPTGLLEKNAIFNKCLVRFLYPSGKQKAVLYFTTYIKVNSKWTVDLHVKKISK